MIMIIFQFFLFLSTKISEWFNFENYGSVTEIKNSVSDIRCKLEIFIHLFKFQIDLLFFGGVFIEKLFMNS